MTEPTQASIEGMKEIRESLGRKDSYKIVEIFYTIQGEGDHVGDAAVFIRFSHCNLGCTWCDTKYDQGGWMTADQIVDEVRKVWHEKCPRWAKPPIIVFTGGEPTLQLDRFLTGRLISAGYDRLTVETNGIKHARALADCITITVSPKTKYGWWVGPAVANNVSIKVVYDPANPDFFEILKKASEVLGVRQRYIQPLEVEICVSCSHPPHGVEVRGCAPCEEESRVGGLRPCSGPTKTMKQTNVKECIDYVMQHPEWRLSLQTHKILGLR